MSTPTPFEYSHNLTRGTKSRWDAEENIKRNPHPDFKKVEASRPAWDPEHSSKYIQTRTPGWQPGDGAEVTDEEWKSKKFHGMEPYEEGRSGKENYTLMLSAFAPRAIGWLSTVSPEGVDNLAPYSYTQVVSAEPPTFIFTSAGSLADPKDTLYNVLKTKECVLNICSDDTISAMNYSAIDSPADVSEWDLTGLHKAPSTHVKPSRVAESPFQAECVLVDVKEWKSKTNPDQVNAVSCFVEVVKFWVREDVTLQAGNPNVLDAVKLRPIARLGGISYARLGEVFEIPRIIFKEERAKEGTKKVLAEKYWE